MRSFYLNTIRIGGPEPVLMGVLNISPESFYPGSYVPFSSLRETAVEMMDQGAQILDIGARSTAPWSTPISISEERERIKTALTELEGLGFTLSIDTMHPEVLRTALQFNIDMVNDISGLSNPSMASIIADAGLPAILMVAKKTPGDSSSYFETTNLLKLVLNRAEDAGISDIILDPGVGRWIPERSAENDWEICRRFEELTQFDRPLLAAVSRKSFIGDATGRTPDQRLAGTLAVTYELIRKGATVIRTHDIRETKDIIKIIRLFQETK